MVSNIESILNNSEMLSKAFNDLRDSIDILKQIELKTPLTDYKGGIYSKEEGNRIIHTYSSTHTHQKIVQIIGRVEFLWNSDYEIIKREIYSNLVKK